MGGRLFSYVSTDDIREWADQLEISQRDLDRLERFLTAQHLNFFSFEPQEAARWLVRELGSPDVPDEWRDHAEETRRGRHPLK